MIHCLYYSRDPTERFSAKEGSKSIRRLIQIYDFINSIDIPNIHCLHLYWHIYECSAIRYY